MLLSPRYSGPTILTIDGKSHDVVASLVGQRRRLESTLATLTDEQWNAQSRCAAWTVRDVVAHLAGINPLFLKSAVAGLDGDPTRLMQYFDPAATPPLMVDAMASKSPNEVLDLFVSSNDELFFTLEGLDDLGWSTPAESPPGDVSIRLLMSHALWDGWVHERDIVLPLGIQPTVVAEEVSASLRYVAALSPAFAIGAGREYPGEFGIEATEPDFSCVLVVDGSVSVRTETAATGVPVLRGSAVELTEALSTRESLPAGSPPEWKRELSEAGVDVLGDVGSEEVEVGDPALPAGGVQHTCGQGDAYLALVKLREQGVVVRKRVVDRFQDRHEQVPLLVREGRRARVRATRLGRFRLPAAGHHGGDHLRSNCASRAYSAADHRDPVRRDVDVHGYGACALASGAVRRIWAR